MSIKTTFHKALNYELGSIPVIPFMLMAILSSIFWISGNLSKGGIVTAFSFMWSLGFILYVIGEKLPLWREYIGGGMIMAFAGSALLVHFGAISGGDAEFLKSQVIDNKFLYLLLVGLVTASILSIDSKTLSKSLVAIMPVIAASIAGAIALGSVSALVLGVAPGVAVTHYILPIMSGGNGAGAIPMAEIYKDVTGGDSAKYYSFAISMLTMANIIAIVSAALLHRLGERFPRFTGRGQLLINRTENIIAEKNSIGDELELNTHGAMFFVFSILLSCFVLYAIFPAIHLFAWVAMLVISLNLLDVIPNKLKVSIMVFSQWGMKVFLVLVLVAIGLTTDVNEIIKSLTITNVFISAATVVGAVIGSAFVGRALGLFPIEAAIIGGLCMANRGGSGDLEVLSAARRMELYPYAQLSSRIGGAVVLVLAGYLFKALN